MPYRVYYKEEVRMFSKYVAAAMHHAAYTLLDDGTFFGEVPELDGLTINVGVAA